MTKHLRPEDFVEALDGALEPSTRAHLAECSACQEELAHLRAVMTDVERVDAPEPSPLFWDHFSARVREATRSRPAPAAGWRAWWRPVGVVATALGAVTLVIALRPTPSPAPPAAGDSAATSLAADTTADDGSWSLVVGLASELKWADVHEAAEPASGTADAMIDELTTAQREAFLKLLQKEMGEL